MEQVTVERYEAGEEASDLLVGDFVLTSGPYLSSKLIRFGQRVSLWGTPPEYAHWNHVALVIDPSGNLYEALGKGIEKTNISRYKDFDYRVARIQASDEDRRQILDFANSAFRARTRYGYLTILSIVLTLLTGSRLILGWAGTAICSGFVAEALCRAGYIFDKPPSHMMPADLARMLNVAK